ncbi:MAG TPA: hypothetical protein VMR34_02445 [Candidatus Saccharimonadales bacterium]|nr:hypothetical protein [Candidatus Saccharimonadales bacterium]
MKRVLLTAASGITTLATVAFMSGSALAWTYGLTGTGQCQTDGSFKITWVVDNSVENEALTITGSSDTAVVPVGTTVAAKSTEDFTQVADGTKAGSDTLMLEGNFPSDSTMRSRTATVTLATACAQPVVIPPVTTTPTPTPPVAATAQAPAPAPVAAPVGPVNAGFGGVKTLDVAAALGLVGSAAIAFLGVRRLSKNQ